MPQLDVETGFEVREVLIELGPSLRLNLRRAMDLHSPAKTLC